MYYPGVNFWDGQTRDQTRLKMEAVVAREHRALIRSSAAMGGLEDVSLALPRWTVDPEKAKLEAKSKPLNFSRSAQRGIVEAVERGLILGDVWADQVVPIWEPLLAATGDLSAWRTKESKTQSRMRRARKRG